MEKVRAFYMVRRACAEKAFRCKLQFVNDFGDTDLSISISLTRFDTEADFEIPMTVPLQKTMPNQKNEPLGNAWNL